MCGRDIAYSYLKVGGQLLSHKHMHHLFIKVIISYSPLMLQVMDVPQCTKDHRNY